METKHSNFSTVFECFWYMCSGCISHESWSKTCTYCLSVGIFVVPGCVVWNHGSLDATSSPSNRSLVDKQSRAEDEQSNLFLFQYGMEGLANVDRQVRVLTGAWRGRFNRVGQRRYIWHAKRNRLLSHRRLWIWCHHFSLHLDEKHDSQRWAKVNGMPEWHSESCVWIQIPKALDFKKTRAHPHTQY